MQIKIYSPEYKTEWDDFVEKSKNGTFLFCRDFMEYHADRFNDHSLMFYVDDVLVALLPGHIANKIYYTHQGLTYGGLVMSGETTASTVMEVFKYLCVTLRQQGIKKIIYKAIPHMYHRLPAEEDLYALFRYKANITERNISSAIFLPNRIQYSDSRKNGLKKAAKNELQVSVSQDFDTFWDILSHNLQTRYNKLPVHTLAEIRHLKDKFPNQIHLIAAIDENNMMQAGCVVFEMESIVHAQYTAASDEGKNKGAVDLIIDFIINEKYTDKMYFDYGTSTEDNGWYLNESLIYQKEGFGARGSVYDTYTIEL